VTIPFLGHESSLFLDGPGLTSPERPGERNSRVGNRSSKGYPVELLVMATIAADRAVSGKDPARSAEPQEAPWYVIDANIYKSQAISRVMGSRRYRR